MLIAESFRLKFLEQVQDFCVRNGISENQFGKVFAHRDNRFVSKLRSPEYAGTLRTFRQLQERMDAFDLLPHAVREARKYAWGAEERARYKETVERKRVIRNVDAPLLR